MNKVILMGRLTRDPEVRQSQNGDMNITRFSIAVDRRFQKGQADFFNCVAFRNTADFVSKWFTKGRMIAVVGSLQNSKYTDKDGNERTATDIVVDEAYFAGSKGDNEAGGGNFGGGQSRGFSAQPESDIPDFDQTGFGTIEESDDDLPF
jgi:single-strand DNA-binding protein